MVRLEMNGRPFDPKTLHEKIMAATMNAAAEQLHARVSAIRHPQTGEFPTVVVNVEGQDRFSVRVEGTPELLALVNAQLHPETDASSDEEADQVASGLPTAPRAFLSFAFEDKELAEQIATKLQQGGVKTWWAPWELKAGDSMPEEINKGLADCTHFIVLLTPMSVSKPWVRQEMDAGIIRKISQKCRFIALRHHLIAGELPPLLAPFISPEIVDIDDGVKQLIADIFGISKKPPLGKPPVLVTQRPSAPAYSAAAMAIAKLFCTETRHGLWADPQFDSKAIAAATGLSEDDTDDALHELSSLTEQHGGMHCPADEFFASLDSFFMDWNPADDALRLATDMVNDDVFPESPHDIATAYGWAPRRLNPALSYLVARKLVDCQKGIGSAPYMAYAIGRTAATRRFVKSRNI